MTETPTCPICQSEHTHPEGDLFVCDMCGHAWDPEEDDE
ncbi:hypothetical protein [Terasakiella pusilla]